MIARLTDCLALLGAGLLAWAARADVAPSTNSPPRWGEFVEPDFPFFSSVLDARGVGGTCCPDNLTSRGLILNLGASLWACFDTELLRVSAVWQGPGVSPVSMAQGSYHEAGRKAPEGEGNLPTLVGTPWLVNGLFPGWQRGTVIQRSDPRNTDPDPTELGRGPLAAADGRFLGVQPAKEGVRLAYEIDTVRISETWSHVGSPGETSVRRRIEVAPHPRPLALSLGRTVASNVVVRVFAESGTSPHPTPTTTAERPTEEGWLEMRFDPTDRPVVLHCDIGFAGHSPSPAPGKSGKPASNPEQKPVPPRPGQETKEPAPGGRPASRWPEIVLTQATLGPGDRAFTLDNLSLPLANPWRRNVRIADLAFFRDGRAATVTFDGDVWIVDGLDGALQSVTWRRFASGLHEPLGIAIRDDAVFVHDRNGLWQLRDTDGNGEADLHELFSNAFAQTSETREFASGLRLAPDGSFVIAHGGQRGSTLARNSGSVMRVSADGKSVETLGWGFRQPFLGVHPVTGLVSVSDQQGHYVPATPLHFLGAPAYHGFLPVYRPREVYPAPIEEPATWIPHPINPSGAGQVWLAGARMGPLNEALIHLGYYRPEIFRVLVASRSGKTQVAVVSLMRDLPFAPLAGAVNPRDGQLYLAGFQIFGSTAPQVSGVARLRYTGQPSPLPRELLATDKGILLRFDSELAPASAVRADNFSAERWEYRRTPEYGSPHFKLDGSKGQETLFPSSAYLSLDRRAVFVGIPKMQRVMQMRFGWSLATSDGLALTQNAYFSPRELVPFQPEAEGFGRIEIDLREGAQHPASMASNGPAPITADEGRRLAELMGCVACHSQDGTTLGRVGPSWKGLAGSRREFSDGTVRVADPDYLRESIREPAKRVVKGFEKSDTGMPSYEGVLSESQIEALILYLGTLR